MRRRIRRRRWRRRCGEVAGCRLPVTGSAFVSGNRQLTTGNVAERLANTELSLIRQINALATPLSVNLGIGEPNVDPDETLRAFAAKAATTGSWHYTANAGTLKLRTLIAGGSRSEIAGREAPAADGPLPNP